MTTRQILVSLGAVEQDGVVGFKSDDKTLDIYPTILEDDGMGYGVDAKYITEALNCSSEGYVNMFIDTEIKDIWENS